MFFPCGYLHWMGLWIILTWPLHFEHSLPEILWGVSPQGSRQNEVLGGSYQQHSQHTHTPAERTTEQPIPSGPNYLPQNWRTGIRFWLQTLPSPLYFFYCTSNSKKWREKQCTDNAKKDALLNLRLFNIHIENTGYSCNHPDYTEYDVAKS